MQAASNSTNTSIYHECIILPCDVQQRCAYLSLTSRKHAAGVAVDCGNCRHLPDVLGAGNVPAGVALHHDDRMLHAVAAELLQVRDDARAEEYLGDAELELVVLVDGCKSMAQLAASFMFFNSKTKTRSYALDAIVNT
jgi:hypothetical protein